MAVSAQAIETRFPKRDFAVVALILADGTVQRLDGKEPDDPTREWAEGRLGGDGWMLWWERRTWTPEARAEALAGRSSAR